MRIGAFRFDTSALTLVRPDKSTVRLRKKSSELLEYLARQEGAVASKQAIFEAVWGDVHVTDDSLTQCVADIRRAFGAEGRALLRTVHGHGYVLDLPKDEAADDVVLPGFAGKMRPALAVLPVTLRNSNPDAQNLGRLITDDLIETLSRSALIDVVTRLSVLQFDRTDPKVADIGTQLGVDHILQTSLSTKNDEVELRLRLTEVSTGRVIWSDNGVWSHDRIIHDISALQDVVSALLRAIINTELETTRGQRLTGLSTHTMLLSAIELAHRAAARQFDAAGTLLTDLRARTGDDASILGWLAFWHHLKCLHDPERISDKHMAMAQSLSKDALDRDDTCLVALGTLGAISIAVGRDLPHAIECFRRAVTFNPNAPKEQLLFGSIKTMMGDGTTGTEMVERGLRLTPGHPHRSHFLYIASGAYIAAGEYDRALKLVKRSLQTDRAYPPAIRMKIIAEAQLGRMDAARSSVRQLQDVAPNSRISAWRKISITTQFPVGAMMADSLRAAGLPD